MSQRRRKPIPVNLIAGPLGVGKTTMINHLLQQRPADERWAVLVNEYGLIGLDAALMATEPDGAPGTSAGVDIREVAGGCICCSASFMFETSLVLLLQRRPDRLLVEPTGLAALSGILDALHRPGISEAVDVRSVVCILDPSRLEEALVREEVKDQVDAADILLASRSDLANVRELDAFHTWAEGFFPPKHHVGRVEHGRLPSALLDAVSGRNLGARPEGHKHGTGHHGDAEHKSPAQMCDETRPIVQRVHRSSQASTAGWICWHGWTFDNERVEAWLQRLAALPGSRRTKAVVRTTRGWWSFNSVGGVSEQRASGYRRDSRFEVVVEGGELPCIEALEQALRGCLSSEGL